jgi:hypothetical protein
MRRFPLSEEAGGGHLPLTNEGNTGSGMKQKPGEPVDKFGCLFASRAVDVR